MIGYILSNTISDHGEVNRGVCNMDADNYLVSMNERKGVGKAEDGRLYYTDDNIQYPLKATTLVSMNLFGFHQTIFEEIESNFEQFVRENYPNPTAEYYIPLIINELITKEKIKLSVLPTEEAWYGVTYQADRPTVVAALERLSKEGHYSSPLWEKTPQQA